MGGTSSDMVPKKAPENSPEELVEYTAGAPYYTINSDGKHKLQQAKEGIASWKVMDKSTVPQVFKMAVDRFGNKRALAVERGVEVKDGKVPDALPLDKWKIWTYKTYYEEVRNVAKGFLKLGLAPHDAVNVFGFNSPEWFISQYAAIFAGGVVAGIYPSDTPDQVQFKSHHSNGAIATCETKAELAKFTEVIDKLPYIKAIIVWADDCGDDITRSDGSVVKTLKWQDLIDLGKAVDNAELDKVIDGLDAADCCALIYTSGTTGNPKAVMISHDSLLFESRCVLQGCLKDVFGKTAEEERILSYLPLSHVAGMMVDVVTPIVCSAFNKAWCLVCFARPYDLKKGTIGARLKVVEPTIFLGVPRVWEKIAEKLRAIGAAKPPLVQKLSAWAKSKGSAYQSEHQLGGKGTIPPSYNLANKIVLSKIKGALGLSKCKFAFTGAAPMPKAILEYYGQLGINVNEVYGMSECTGATTWSSDKHHLWGSVGFEMPGTEVKVFKVSPDGSRKECPRVKTKDDATDENQGEICFRGRHIMMGYMANPKLGEAHVAEIAKKNAEAIDKDGWLHSGDMGVKTESGVIHITGRYKELIIGAGGENIAPVPIEDNIKALCPAVSNIQMIGDKRKFNVALITLKCVGATGELPGTDVLDGAAADALKSGKTISDACKDKAFIKMITDAITATNNDGSCVPSNAAKIQKFTILPIDFSVQTGDLTATLKAKRSVIEKKYTNAIDAMYASKETFVPFVE